MAWLEVAVSYMRDGLNKYKDLGYKVYEVDTLYGYKINKPKTLILKQDQLSCFFFIIFSSFIQIFFTFLFYYVYTKEEKSRNEK